MPESVSPDLTLYVLDEVVDPAEDEDEDELFFEALPERVSVCPG